MATLHLLGNTLVIAPLEQQRGVGGLVLLPGRHYTPDPQLWKVLQVGPGRKNKKGQLINCEIGPGDTILTAPNPEPLHEFTDGVRIVDANVALAVL